MKGRDEDTPSGAPPNRVRPVGADRGPDSGSVAALGPAAVVRTALVDLMLQANESVISVVAPPGYGKSTLLAQWAQRRPGRVIWVSCDEVAEDGDPIGHVTSGLDADTGPVSVVLDGLDAWTSRASGRSVAALAKELPTGWRLALASREEVPLPEARMHVDHRLVEISADDLAMSRAEASRLLAAAGVELSEQSTAQLVQQTGGWPAALYLAALAIKADEATDDRPFTGTDRLMSDYLRSEVLSRLSRSQRTFLVRTSILDRLSGPLCEAVVGESVGTRLLEQLRRRHLLVVPLDRRGEWYRLHPLLRQLLEAELHAESPELVADLHARAVSWLETNGEPERAIHHAYLAGEPKRFGQLVLATMQQVWANGQIDTVVQWMERLGQRAPTPHTPAMIAHGALIFALLGREGDTERWTAVAESLPGTGVLPDGSTVEATMAYLRANLCREGPAVMRRDSLAALEELGPSSPYRATMLHTEGLSYLLEGDLEQADASFAHAYDLAASIEASPVAAMVLAEQVLIAAERAEWTAAESLVKRALEITSRGPYDEYWTSAVVFASAARVAAHRGDMREAREYARRASRLRPLLTYALPVVSVQALVELARAYLALVDPSGARAVLEQVRGILQQRPDLGTLAVAAHELDERVSQITAATPVGGSSLTAAELRLVPLLPTHLTYPEIGERLFISRHTVKTQAGSVYRKLGASSRKEAVDRIVELGLM